MKDILLDSYKTEFETTDISLTELMTKYNLTKKDLKGYTKWSKQTDLQSTQEFASNQQIILATLPQTTLLSIATPPADTEPPAKELTVLEKIDQFKEKAVDRALNFIQVEAQFAEVKEFKDIVAIVDSIEKSYMKPGPNDGQPQINILIQNLMQNFKDDC